MEAIAVNYPQSDSDESSSDSFEEMDAEEETPAALSETRMVREMGELKGRVPCSPVIPPGPDPS